MLCIQLVSFLKPWVFFAKKSTLIKFEIYIIIPHINMHNNKKITFPEQRQKPSQKTQLHLFIAPDAQFCWYKIGAKIDKKCKKLQRWTTYQGTKNWSGVPGSAK